MSRKETNSHEDLRVRREAIQLVTHIYKFTTALPAHEQFVLTSQLRRAAVGIAANIAEGAARGTTNQFLHFLSIAQGSLAEVDTLLVVVREIYQLGSDLQPQIIQLRRMLIKLRGSLAAKL